MLTPETVTTTMSEITNLVESKCDNAADYYTLAANVIAGLMSINIHSIETEPGLPPDVVEKWLDEVARIVGASLEEAYTRPSKLRIKISVEAKT